MTYLSVDLMLTVQYLNQHNCREISLLMYEEQGQTVHKLQFATFWDKYSISPPVYIFCIYKIK